jgi:glycosyltransferase involved in cell wall biosynthesis
LVFQNSLNILVVCAYYHPAIVYGGPVAALYGFTKNLIKSGHAVTIFTTDADGTGNLEVPTGCEVMVDGVPVYYFKRWWFGRTAKPFTLFFSPDMGKQLARLKPGDYDMVVVQASFLDPGRMAAKAAKRANIPYFCYTQGSLAPWAINHKWLKKRIYLGLIEEKILQQSAGIVVCNDTELEYLKRIGITAPAKRIPWGIDSPESLVKPDRRALAEMFPSLAGGNRYVLFLSRLHPVKGLELLVPAFARVAPHYPDWRLVIAGPDEGGYQKVLESMIEQLGAGDRIIVTGMVKESGKAALLANAEVFTLPSFSEGFSMSVAEALGYERPVVITKTCYVPEVQEWNCGLTVQSDIEALAEALSQMMRDKDFRRACSQNAHRLAVEHFTWEAVMRVSLEFFTEGMKRHAA